MESGTFHGWVKNRLRERGRNQKDLVDVLGVSEAQVSKKLAGLKLEAAELQRIAPLLEVQLEDLQRRMMESTLRPPKPVRRSTEIPVLNRTVSGLPTDVVDWDPRGGATAMYVPRTEATLDVACVALIVDDDCMAPHLLPGDIIVLAPPTPSRSLRVGDPVVFVWPNDWTIGLFDGDGKLRQAKRGRKVGDHPARIYVVVEMRRAFR
jgi:hypothetical protein